MNPNPNSQIELAVEIKSLCCANKVKKAIQEIHGVKNVIVDSNKQCVVVEGDVVAEKLKDIVEQKTGMNAVIMGLGSASEKKNLGSAVAAIAVGNSSVRGLLRLNQIDPKTCVIEGSLDGLPDSKNLHVSLHETGDLSKGCDSCGPLYSHLSENAVGFVNHLEPDSKRSVQFRCTSSKLNVEDLYGLSMVVHDGSMQQIKNNLSQRLACGIIARSSGMFENSKRFCACDGVSIWEEKKKGDGLLT